MDALLTAPTPSRGQPEPEKVLFQPQPGPQVAFLQSRADIAVMGGGAGGGKSYALLLEVLRHIRNPQFAGIIFRRTYPRLTQPGGLAERSKDILPMFGASGYSSGCSWHFPAGGQLQMSHLQHANSVMAWGGSQMPFIAFDELTEFEESQFFFMLSRNRSTSGIPGYIRATTNPVADSWVARLLAWWIDQDTGFAIPERSGVLRWFVRQGDDLVWASEREELPDGGKWAKSVTFIPAKLSDNKILMASDPSYEASLRAMSRVERERLLDGNWKVRPCAGMYFKRQFFAVVNTPPAARSRCVRFWDRAASTPTAENPDPDWTVGVKVSRTPEGFFYVEDVLRMRCSPHQVKVAMVNTAAQDGPDVTVGMYQDPGSAGVGEAQDMVRALAGYHVHVEVATKDKETRAKPASSQAENNFVRLVKSDWNDAFLTELENFPDAKHDDQVDPFSSAITYLSIGASAMQVVKGDARETQQRASTHAQRGRLLI